MVPPGPQPAGSSVAGQDAGPLFALRGVSRIHDGGAIAALRNVDLEIEAGECVAIVGASGSGKSSLVNLLCGIDRASSGMVLWEGRVLHAQRHWARLRRHSRTRQRSTLSPTATISSAETRFSHG